MTLLLVALGAVVVWLVVRAVALRSGGLSSGDLMQLVNEGAQVVDVRTPGEFASAHAEGSRNIPLDELSRRLAELDRARPVVVCCASGARSAAAKSLLERAGFAAVHNAGPWQRVEARG